MIHDSGFHCSWELIVDIGGDLSYSSRLLGRVNVSGEEDACAVATLSLQAAIAAEVGALDGQPITISVRLFREGIDEQYPLFVGSIEEAEFDDVECVISLSCRDAYERTILACQTAADVDDLLMDAAPEVSIALNPWDSAAPDPLAYYDRLMESTPGSAFIDATGTWRAVRWAIGDPVAIFSPADIYAEGFSTTVPDASAIPQNVIGNLVVRHHRLHNMEFGLSWSCVDYVRYVVDGVPNAQKSMIQQAIEGLSDWYVKGEITLTEPTPGEYTLSSGATTVHYYIDVQVAPSLCDAMAAHLYRRWYQQCDTTFKITIPLGGSGEDVTVSASLQSDFDAGAWETAKPSEPASALYQANAPATPVVKTGYEALSEPWPPANSAIDHYGTVDAITLSSAGGAVIAMAVRRAAEYLRKRHVKFSRPIDPRFSIGTILGVNGYGVSAVGQVVAYEHEFDHDSGDAVSTYTLACPAGNGTTTGLADYFVNPPEITDLHGGWNIPLGNHIGAAWETPEVPDEDTLVGFLCNVLPTADSYDATKPVYNTQFRIIMPGIEAVYRDPITAEGSLSATITLAAGVFEVDF